MTEKKKYFLIKQALLFALRLSIVYVAGHQNLPIDISLLSLFLDVLEKT